MIDNGYKMSFVGRRYETASPDVQAGINRRSLRVKLRLDGAFTARYEGRCAEIAQCGPPAPAAPAAPREPPRLNLNAHGKSRWMGGFWDRPAPPMWPAIERSAPHA